jgi:hypothetical protein
MANTSYSAEVIKYMRDTAEAFAIPDADHKAIDDQFWPAQVKALMEGALYAMTGLIVLAVFTWTIGWVVRGFLGIPRGHDHRVG